jgi:aldehyde:ferredoxin oxidoreductase
MEELVASGNRVLEVNLSTRRVSEFRIGSAERRTYLGGKGLGLKYLYERLKPGEDPLGPGNVLVFMTGFYLGSNAPCSGRFSGLTKSPLTGIIVHCSCGGPFGSAYKTAGYEGLIVRGKSTGPIYLDIHPDGVEFVEAADLWGLDTLETQEALKPGKADGVLAIGPAGENGVLYANIASGHRFLGRGGMGAVMGSKNLKAVAARGGKYKIVPYDQTRFKKVFREATRRINQNEYVGHLMRNYGTNANVTITNTFGLLPVENFRGGKHPRAGEVSGETMKEIFKIKPSTCKPCTILCGHKGSYPDGVHQIPEYETNALFGPNTGNFDQQKIREWNEICNRMGMDTISVAGTLAYSMEAGEKGLLQTDLKFGSPQGISEMLADIAYRRGLGAELANGSRWLAKKYGGLDFAIQVKGLEMAGYDPRGAWGQGLSYAVANRGACHLSGTTFLIETFLRYLQPESTQAKAKFVLFLENTIAASNSLPTCLFTGFAYFLEARIVTLTPHKMLAFTMQKLPDVALGMMDLSILTEFFMAITGEKLNKKEFLRAGERTHILERWMNTREGIRRCDDTLPGRFLKEGRDSDPQHKVVPLDEMVGEYYRLRGYDDEGIPEAALLEKLGIGEIQPAV